MGTGVTSGQEVGLSGDADRLAAALARMPDYRVLRRIRAMRRLGSPGQADGLVAGCALDVETTGLDHRNDSVIELAMCRFLADPSGRIVDVGRSWRWLEDPGRPIEPHITRLTGIRDEDVRGRAISEGEATSLLLDADFVIAHNAAFDRPFVEKRLPMAAGRPWVCSMADIDWRVLGFEGRALSHLLMQMGWFYSAHRADTDVLALLRLVDHRIDGDRTALAEALSTARRPTSMVEAVDAPFATKDILKARGYRWNGTKRWWWREVPRHDLAEELEWATREVYGGSGAPKVREMDWTRRHAAPS